MLRIFAPAVTQNDNSIEIIILLIHLVVEEKVEPCLSESWR